MKNDNYFIDKLEQGKAVKILFMSHNSYWPYLEKLANRYENCWVDIFGMGTYYVRARRNFTPTDYDFIIFYSSELFDENELLEMKNIAFQISNENNKRVSIGYSYILPMEQRKYENISEEFKIVSFSNSVEYEETSLCHLYFSPSDLIDSVAITHDELEYTKVKKKNTIIKNADKQ